MLIIIVVSSLILFRFIVYLHIKPFLLIRKIEKQKNKINKMFDDLEKLIDKKLEKNS